MGDFDLPPQEISTKFTSIAEKRFFFFLNFMYCFPLKMTAVYHFS